MGTQFETSDHRTAQERLGPLLAAAYRCELIELPTFSPIDWLLVRRGEIVGAAELKCRSVEHGKYPTVFLEARKARALVSSALALSVSERGWLSLFMVEWRDAVGVFDASLCKGMVVEHVSLNAPRERHDIDDPVYCVACHEFELLIDGRSVEAQLASSKQARRPGPVHRPGPYTPERYIR
jgi:hypothetical protein